MRELWREANGAEVMITKILFVSPFGDALTPKTSFSGRKHRNTSSFIKRLSFSSQPPGRGES